MFKLEQKPTTHQLQNSQHVEIICFYGYRSKDHKSINTPHLCTKNLFINFTVPKKPTETVIIGFFQAADYLRVNKRSKLRFTTFFNSGRNSSCYTKSWNF